MTDTVRYDECMHHAHAGKQYGCAGPNYEDITWNEPDEAKPTQEELDVVWETVQPIIAARERNNNRFINYPSQGDLVVALWEKLVETDGLSSTDIDALQTKRVQVKADYPKE
jgi:hypothetical protein